MAKRTDDTEKKTPEEQENGAAGSPTENVSSKMSPEYAEMLRIASRIPTAYKAGSRIPTEIFALDSNSTISNPRLRKETTYISNPGIMTFRWVPTLGVAEKATDPVNMAIKEQYSFIRHANSGARNYEASDLGIYELSLDSIYGLYYALVRAYGLINRYSALNAYTPAQLLEAMGFNYDDLVANQASFAFFLNNIRAKLKEFALPGTMRMFRDHMDLNSVVYTDGETEHAQFYVFIQDTYWSYEKVDEVKGLTAKQLPRPATFAQIVDFMHSLLTAFLESSDVALISGDILKAYGDSAINTLPLLEYDYQTVVGKSDSMLVSINNALMIPVDTESLRVVDAGNGNLHCVPKKTARTVENIGAGYPTLNYVQNVSNYIESTPFISFVSNEPSDEEVAAAFRFRPTLKRRGISESTKGFLEAESKQGYYRQTVYEFESCGTEIITHAEVWTFGYKDVWVNASTDYSEVPGPIARGGLTYQAFASYVPAEGFGYSGNLGSMLWSGTSNLPWTISLISSISAFDWAPAVCFTAFYSTDYNDTVNGIQTVAFKPICDSQNAVPVSRDMALSINQARVYAALYTE